MKIVLLILSGVVLANTAQAQLIYGIKGDSIRIYNGTCNAELIVENSSMNVSGFLINNGNGRTRFQSGLIRLNDSLYLIGKDTLNFNKSASSIKWFKGSISRIGTSYIGITSGPSGTGTAEGTSSNLNNIYIGLTAGNENTSGANNVFLGPTAGSRNTTGAYNVYLGNGAGGANTTGINNIVLGALSGAYGNAGANNICIGFAVPGNNVENSIYIGRSTSGLNRYGGGNNIAIGTTASSHAPRIFRTISIGDSAGYSKSHTTGNTISNNVFIGASSGKLYSLGINNTAIGAYTAEQFNNGDLNSLYGFYSGNGLMNGFYNCLFGDSSGFALADISQSTFFGSGSGKANAAGIRNVFLGYRSGIMNTSGSNNSFLGHSAGNSNVTGNNSVFLGSNAGDSANAGNNNLIIGSSAQLPVSTGNDQINIGNYLYKDASGNLGVGLINPSYKLHSATSGKFEAALTTRGRITAFISKTSSYILNNTDEFVAANATALPFTIILPTAQGKVGQTYTIKKVDASANAVTLVASSSQRIDGEPEYQLTAQWKCITVVSDGINWMVQANK
ncbi:MAG: hypothetical protein P0Y53_10970 [Candidatus Pseudobacter hemicellulosilyticus]|uniref:T9SS C-terminal target domain-containing protein n=1 Tax=Candidatus Pseudobacter hemicellulosilyticus TaxID=3121375 RepID=A0AAJ5WWT1_9BACT|nr:MAG: hypothetical protein P0Y53_10970 [Pseudobacter sp.]